MLVSLIRVKAWVQRETQRAEMQMEINNMFRLLVDTGELSPGEADVQVGGHLQHYHHHHRYHHHPYQGSEWPQLLGEAGQGGEAGAELDHALSQLKENNM